MTGYLTGYMYGKLINATHLELIRGGWFELTERQAEDVWLSSYTTDKPEWV